MFESITPTATHGFERSTSSDSERSTSPHIQDLIDKFTGLKGIHNTQNTQIICPTTIRPGITPTYNETSQHAKRVKANPPRLSNTHKSTSQQSKRRKT